MDGTVAVRIIGVLGKSSAGNERDADVKSNEVKDGFLYSTVPTTEEVPC